MASRGCSAPTLAIQRHPAPPLPEFGAATLGFIVTDVGAHRPASAQLQHGGKVAFVKDSDGHLIERVEML